MAWLTLDDPAFVGMQIKRIPKGVVMRCTYFDRARGRRWRVVAPSLTDARVAATEHQCPHHQPTRVSAGA